MIPHFKYTKWQNKEVPRRPTSKIQAAERCFAVCLRRDGEWRGFLNTEGRIYKPRLNILQEVGDRFYRCVVNVADRGVEELLSNFKVLYWIVLHTNTLH